MRALLPFATLVVIVIRIGFPLVYPSFLICAFHLTSKAHLL